MESGIEKEALKLFKFTNGYFNSDLLVHPDDCLASGSKNLIITGSDSLRVFRGLKDTTLTGGRTMVQIPTGYASLVDFGGSQGNGSIAPYVNESLLIIGGGHVYINGLYSGIDLTTNGSNLRIAVKVSGSYGGSTTYLAGMNQPSTPTVGVHTNSASTMDGLYSFKIAKVRSATGGASNASLTSAVLDLEPGESARLTFPTIASSEHDKWAIFVTKAGFGGTGVHYLWKEIADTALSTIDGVARSYEVLLNDSDLLPTTAYIDNYPPQTGSFAARLENYALVLGCYTNAIQASLRNFPESFHPEYLAFLPKRPTAVLTEQQGAYLYVATETSVHALSVAPAAYENPLILQTVWSDTGIENSHNWCSYKGVIFAFVSRQGAVAMDAAGNPSAEFAIPVEKEMKGWEVDDTSVFAVPDLNSVVYINNGTIKKAMIFNVQNRKWSAPIYLSDYVNQPVYSGVVVNRRLQISMGSVFDLYEFDEQTGSTATNYIAMTPDVEIYPEGRINILGMKGKFFSPAATGTTNIKLFCDYATSPTKTLAHTNTAIGMTTTKETRYWLARKNAVRISIEASQSDFTKEAYPSYAIVYGTREASNYY
jgi:hypothetical protein